MSQQQSPFALFLGSLKHESLYFEELEGNNGDRLIQMGMRELFRQLGIHPVATPGEADCILLNGGGAANDFWPSGTAQVLQSYLKEFPDKKFVVGPSSFHFTRLDFASIVNATKAPLTLFCREHTSLGLLQKMPLGAHVDVQLSPDLAFELRDSDFIAQQMEDLRETHILCAMRKDCEGNAGLLTKTAAPWLPAVLRRPLSKLRDRLVAGKSSDILSPILNEISSSQKSPVVYRDVSVSVPFEEFCQQIRHSREIVTNRLHIAIFGSLLGKPVHLLPGSYHKITGVYDFSLKANPSVRLHQATG
jgi:exopolysaccharide biosynthesis predicted pyruvyltransferase EpsI